MALEKRVAFDMESRVVDVVNPDHSVEVVVQADGWTVWVNVDGACVCRIQGLRPGMLTISNEAEGTRSVT